MAETFAKNYRKGKIVASRVGSKRSEKINPVVVQATLEKRMDITQDGPKRITEQMLREVEMVVTIGCNAEEACLAIFIKDIIDCKLEDPKD